MSITVQITGDALPWAKRLEAAERSPRLRKVGAAAAAKTVRQHFVKLDRERHRGGRHHYYGQAARSTSWAVRNDEMLVVIDHVGIAQRYFGGTIRAKNAGALTIPVEGSEAEGRRASEFSDLFAVMRDNGRRGFLARTDAAGKLIPLYWLRKEVHQDPDPDVLPQESELLGSAVKAMEDVLDRI